MKPLMWAGAFISAIGVLALLAGSGIHYRAHERLPHGASAQVTVREEKVLIVPPLAGGLTLAAGIAIMIVASRR